MTEEKFVEELEHLLERAGKLELFTLVVRQEGKWCQYSGFSSDRKANILLERFLADTEGKEATCRN